MSTKLTYRHIFTIYQWATQAVEELEAKQSRLNSNVDAEATSMNKDIELASEIRDIIKEHFDRITFTLDMNESTRDIRTYDNAATPFKIHTASSAIEENND